MTKELVFIGNRFRKPIIEQYGITAKNQGLQGNP